MKILANLFRLSLVFVLLAGCSGAPTAQVNTPDVPTPTSVKENPTPMNNELAGLLKQGGPLAPTVVETSVAKDAGNGVIEVVFDQPMDPKTTAAALRVTGPAGGQLQGQVSWPEPTRLRFQPAQTLKADGAYQVHLKADATSAQGVALRDAVRLNVAAAGALQVAQVFPADKTENVASDSVITVLFNRPVVALKIAEEQNNLPHPLKFDPPVEGTGEWVNTSVYVFHPNGVLKSNTAYTVSIPAGLADATNSVDPLPADYVWGFHTLPPGVKQLQIKLNDKESIEFGDKRISTAAMPLQPEFSLTFLQPMDRASTTAALQLIPEGHVPVPLKTNWSTDNFTVNFTPTERLALGTAYEISLPVTAKAEDGSPLGTQQTWSFHSVPAPKVELTRPTDGAKNVDPFLEIRFASPMNLKSIQSRVEFNPPLEGANNSYYDEYQYSMNFYGLKYSTTYTVRLLPGMQDIYGNTIDKEQVIRFTTMPQYPSAGFLVPDRALFRLGSEENNFYSRLVNVNTVTYTLARMSLDQVGQFYRNGGQYRPLNEDVVWTYEYHNETAQDQTKLVKLPVGGPEKQPLAQGFYLLALDSPEIKQIGSVFDDTRVIMVSEANLMLKTSPTDALVWLTGLENGKPVPDTRVRVYDWQALPKVIAEGQTNGDGLAQMTLPTFVPDPNKPYPSYFAVAGDGSGLFAFADAWQGAGVSPMDFGIWESYYEQPIPDILYLYTERPIYRPGQPVYFKGILRKDDDLHYTLPDAKEVEITIRSYDKEVYNAKLPISDWGTFNGTFTLDKQAALGMYGIEVKYPGSSSAFGYGSFNVAEYRRPEFQVRLDVAQKDVLTGSDFSANLQAAYYAGGGVANAKVHWTLVSQPFTFTPPDKYSGYSFTDYDFDAYYDYYNRKPDGGDNLLAEGDGQTDAQGNLTLTIPAKLKTDASQKLVLETTVTDFAETTVTARAEVVAHRSQVYPGVRFESYIATAKQEQTANIVALDWAGNPVPGQQVDVQVVERRWHSVQEQDEQGNIKWSSSVEEIPVAQFEGVALDADGKGSVKFTPPNGGVFKVKVAARDTHGNTGVASNIIWVTGEDFIPWRQTNNRGFQLVTDKTSYRPGETAELLIASPFQGEAYALVTVERGKIRQVEMIKLESNSTVYRLPVTGEMAPNVYLSVMVVKGIDENNPRPNFKLGMAEIKVATDQQALNVSVQPDKPTAGPGDSVTYTVQTKDTAGQPVSAEVSLGLSDLATLSLLPPNSVPILQGFYDRRGLRVRTSMAMVNNIDDYNTMIAENAKAADGRGAGSGGGKGEGDLGVVEVRQNFPDTAFWQADVRTGSGGAAQVTVRLPDNLTTWRMDARAVTQDTQVGQVTNDLVSTKPLLLRPQTPRFFVAGDQVTLGAAVHNNSGEDLSVQAELDAKGVTLDGAVVQTVQIPSGQQAYVSWKARVQDDAQTVDLVYSVKGGAYSDASRPTIGDAGQEGLKVYRYEAPETVATAGQLTEAGSQAEGIRLPETMAVSQGQLKVNISPSLSASLTDSLTFLEHFQYECIEQTVSRFLPNVMVTRVLKEAGQSDPVLEENLKTQVNLAIQRLASKQHGDGGWGWWERGSSDELITAYAALGLLEASDAGYEVPQKMVTDAVNYLGFHASTLPNSPGLAPTARMNRQAFITFVLARANKADAALVGKLYDDRLKLDLYARAYIMRAMFIQNPKDQRLDTLRSDFASAAVLSASGMHWEEAEADLWNWNNDTRTTSIVLGTLVETDPQNPLVANAVRWLMAHRTKGHWSGTQDTAWTLMALANWMRASGELKANYDYAVGLNDQVLKQGKASPETMKQTETIQVGVSSLLKDSVNKLVVARGNGSGNLYYTADLTVYLPVPQIEALDRGIVVSREYYRDADPNTPVSQAEPGETLRAKITVIAPKALHYVFIDDPLPAGLEAIDTSLQTSPQAQQPEQYRINDLNEKGWGWWYFDQIQLRDEKLVLSASYLPAGTYIYTYLVRASTPGIFNVIPPTAQEFYFPEVYGRGKGMSFEVK